MGRVFFGGGKVGMEYKKPYPANFASATWAEIIEACQANEVPDTWTVGSSKNMAINGISYAIDIIGKNHDTYADGSGKAPLTFQMHDCYGTKKYQLNTTRTNAGGWTNCVMRSTHLPAIFELMPNEVQTGIKEVKKLTSAGGSSTTINTTADKLFLLSEIEVMGTTHYSVTGEGSQYAYYAAGNSAIKNLQGSTSGWWVRSPRSNTADQFCFITNTVNSAYRASATYSDIEEGIAPAFCF